MKHTECGDCKLREGDCGHHFKMDGKTNYDIASLSACDQYEDCMFFKPKAKSTGDLISREELKKNKFVIPDIQFVGNRRNGKTIERITLAYNKGWNAAIDAIYENAPAVEQPINEWGKWVISEIKCPNCLEYFQTDCYSMEELKKCPNCGADMEGDNK